jgi:hypothetical protein
MMSIVVMSMIAPMSARQCGCSERDALLLQPTYRPSLRSHNGNEAPSRSRSRTWSTASTIREDFASGFRVSASASVYLRSSRSSGRAAFWPSLMERGGKKGPANLRRQRRSAVLIDLTRRPRAQYRRPLKGKVVGLKEPAERFPTELSLKPASPRSAPG